MIKNLRNASALLLFVLVPGLTQSLSQQKIVASRVNKYKHLIDEAWISSELKFKMMALRNYGVVNEVIQYRLAYQDVDSVKLNRLVHDQHFDVREAEKYNAKTYYDADALWSDAIVYGKVDKVVSLRENLRCFDVAYDVKVSKVVKGFPKMPLEQKVIRILQRTSSESFEFERNHEYMFFLSRAQLEYYVNTNQQHCATDYPLNCFVASNRSPHLLGENKIEYLCPFHTTPSLANDTTSFRKDVLSRVYPILDVLAPGQDNRSK